MLPLFKIRDLKRKKTDEVEIIGEVKEKKLIPFTKVPLARVYLSDDTGTIILNLWRDQVNQVEVGDFIHLKNAFTEKYKRVFVLNTWEKVIEKIETQKIKDTA